MPHPQTSKRASMKFLLGSDFSFQSIFSSEMPYPISTSSQLNWCPTHGAYSLNYTSQTDHYFQGSNHHPYYTHPHLLITKEFWRQYRYLLTAWKKRKLLLDTTTCNKHWQNCDLFVKGEWDQNNPSSCSRPIKNTWNLTFGKTFILAIKLSSVD